MNIKIKKPLLEVSIPREGGSIVTTMGIKESLAFFGGKNGDWQVHELLKSFTVYDVELRGICTKGKELIVTLEFSSKEELDKFYAEHNQA